MWTDTILDSVLPILCIFPCLVWNKSSLNRATSGTFVTTAVVWVCFYFLLWSSYERNPPHDLELTSTGSSTSFATITVFPSLKHFPSGVIFGAAVGKTALATCLLLAPWTLSKAKETVRIPIELKELSAI